MVIISNAEFKKGSKGDFVWLFSWGKCLELAPAAATHAITCCYSAGISTTCSAKLLAI